MLCLSNTDVEDVLDLDAAIAVTDRLYRDYAAGTASWLPPKNLVAAQHTLRVAGGAVGSLDGLGVRAGFFGGANFVMLYGDSGADLLCVMAYPFSRLRTAGLMGLVTRQFARPDATQVAMIGSGKNAVGYLQAACSLRGVEVVRVYSRDPEHRRDFAERVEKLTGTTVSPVASPQEATAGADIVYVSTNSKTPALSATDIAPGTFVASMGQARELDASVYLAADDTVISYKPSDRDHLDRHSQLLELVAAGERDWDRDVHTLGNVLAGVEPVVPGPDTITLFRDFQTGFGDIALALAAYHECMARGRGVHVEL